MNALILILGAIILVALIVAAPLVIFGFLLIGAALDEMVKDCQKEDSL